MKIQVRKCSQSEWLLMYIFALPFAFSFLIDLLHFPSFIKYTIDFALVVLLLLIYLNRKRLESSQISEILKGICVFFAITIVGFFLANQSIVYYVWGFRNNFRFFLFFVACALMMKRESADFCMKLMDALFYINCIVSLYQVFIMDAHQDHVGGIFGSTRGCNAYTNIYFMIIVAWHMLRYMNKEESLMKFAIKCGISLGIAALAELKFFFLEFIFITVVATVITKFSIRKFLVIMGSAAGLVVSIRLLAIMFPYFADWFSLNEILEYVSSNTGYTSTNDLNRLTAVTISWNRFLETWPQKLFGLGLGNCDYSSNFSFLTTAFYERYKHLNYIWFSSSFLMLETGLLGLITYIWFFICVGITAKKVEKSETQNIVYCQLARIIALIAPILVVYNASLRMECAYMLFFVLALPFIQQSPSDDKRKQKDIYICKKMEEINDGRKEK